MRRYSALLVAGLLLAPVAHGQTTVSVDDSSAGWLGFMNISELPANGGAFVFGSGWGLADLTSSFDDGAATLTMGPAHVNDPDPFWTNPDNSGNKQMEANLYQESTGVFNGQTVTFEGEVLSDTISAGYTARLFISDFAPDYGSRVDSFFDITTTGAFSFSLATIADANRHIQWGIQMTGVNLDFGSDPLAFPEGSVVLGTIPAPGAVALLGLGGLAMTRRRR